MGSTPVHPKDYVLINKRTQILIPDSRDEEEQTIFWRQIDATEEGIRLARLKPSQTFAVAKVVQTIEVPIEVRKGM